MTGSTTVILGIQASAKKILSKRGAYEVQQVKTWSGMARVLSTETWKVGEIVIRAPPYPASEAYPFESLKKEKPKRKKSISFNILTMGVVEMFPDAVTGKM